MEREKDSNTRLGWSLLEGGSWGEMRDGKEKEEKQETKKQPKRYYKKGKRTKDPKFFEEVIVKCDSGGPLQVNVMETDSDIFVMH
jgi:hypothetical protein